MSATEQSIDRKHILRQRDAISEETRKAHSSKIATHLRGLTEYQKSSLPLIYVSFRSEVSTHEIIRERLDAGLPVAVPRTDMENKRLDTFIIRNWDKELRPGAYGILEPDPALAEEIQGEMVDLVLVPGSIFDERGGRYGYGGGYYDRFLSITAPKAVRIGLAFSMQVYPKIPLEPHDQLMDIIITEEKIIRCREIPR